MTIDTTEKKFEDSIESILLKSGYIKRITENFDKKFALDSEILFQFLQKSQKEKLKKIQEIYGSSTQEEILRALYKELEDESMIHVLRNGFSLSDIKLDCAYFKPVSGLNPESKRQYEQNVLSIIRQARYSLLNEKSMDILLCLNGFPIATAELKNYRDGFEDAKTQYQQDRDPKEKLFQFKKRAFVHFAIDPFEIHMTTKLDGNKTEFLPFNMGRDEGNGKGRGNPDNPSGGYRTSYLWEKILQKDQWLDIIGNYVSIQIIPQKYPTPPKESIIFPRFHQLDAVNLLETQTKQKGPGPNYLIQHSTGSGKSNTIAWLSYKLFSLHDKEDKPVFDSVIVLSDRIGIVNQLAKYIEQFEQTKGTVERMETTQMLVDNLENSKKIVVTTQQKFPPALKKIGQIKGKKFAIIIDEAHSSQVGESALSVIDVLTTNLADEAKKESESEKSKKDLVDYIEELGSYDNLSYYAFTATPKQKTLKLFGLNTSGDEYQPHHEYSMKQAIEEGFILDVLQNYVTYDQYFKLVKTSTQEKIVEGKKAAAVILKWVNSHDMSIEAKSEIIVNDFEENVKPAIGGLAKAMVVTSARIAAFKYKRAIDEIIKSKKLQGIKTLVAFSGSIKDEENKTHTEQSLNKTSTDEELRELFDTSEYNILIVAEKYQTGFDQPLLHTMYVDKALQGIKAVQTLSRLNRYHPLKEETRVLDFQNTTDEIKKSFEHFYSGTTLIDKVDPVFLLELFSTIMSYRFITQNDLDEFASIFFKSQLEQKDSDHAKLFSIMESIIQKYSESDEKTQDEFRFNIIKYHKEYSFLTRLVRYNDANLEKLYALIKFIITKRLLPGISLQVDSLKGDISLQRFRLERTHEGSISLDSQKKTLKAGQGGKGPREPDVLTSLSSIIRAMNEHFGIGFELSDADVISIEDWMGILKKMPDLKEIAQSPYNDIEDFTRAFREEFDKIIVNPTVVEQYKGLVSKIFENEQYHSAIVKKAAEIYYDWSKTNNIPPITPANPSENRLRLRQTIANCKGHLHWVDRYFNLDGLEFLMMGLNQNDVKEIKLLTSVYQDGINQQFYNEFVKFQKEMQTKEISCEMQVIMTKDLHRQMHDRYIIAQNVTYNVPSPTTVKLGQFSEIKRSSAKVPFDDWWNSSDSVDIIKNWDVIKAKREQLSRRF